jgi:hypothetical protein
LIRSRTHGDADADADGDGDGDGDGDADGVGKISWLGEIGICLVLDDERARGREKNAMQGTEQSWPCLSFLAQESAGSFSDTQVPYITAYIICIMSLCQTSLSNEWTSACQKQEALRLGDTSPCLLVVDQPWLG